MHPSTENNIFACENEKRMTSPTRKIPREIWKTIGMTQSKTWWSRVKTVRLSQMSLWRIFLVASATISWISAASPPCRRGGRRWSSRSKAYSSWINFFPSMQTNAPNKLNIRLINQPAFTALSVELGDGNDGGVPAVTPDDACICRKMMSRYIRSSSLSRDLLLSMMKAVTMAEKRVAFGSTQDFKHRQMNVRWVTHK